MNKVVARFIVLIVLSTIVVGQSAAAVSEPLFSTDLGVFSNHGDTNSAVHIMAFGAPAWELGPGDVGGSLYHSYDQFDFSLTSPHSMPMQLDLLVYGDITDVSYNLVDSSGYDANNWVQIALNSVALNTAAFSGMLSGLVSGNYSLLITGDVGGFGGLYSTTLTAVPLPPAALLFISALIGVGVFGRKKKGITTA
ncbi:MAG: hypothetical protein GY779_01350 [Gammaproteobacteria bacterium]|nr:hypothetical protein [Gammaproteobacteria bacterium]